MKKLLFGFLMICIVVIFNGCSNTKESINEQNPKDETVTVTSTPEVTKTPQDVTQVVEPTVEVIAPTSTVVEDDIPAEEDPIIFRGTVTNIDPIITVQTSELNAGTQEEVIIHPYSINLQYECADSKYFISRYCPINELQVGDEIEVESNYAIIDGLNVVRESDYNWISLIKGNVTYDFSKEELLSDVINNKINHETIQSLACSYQPEFYKKPFQSETSASDKIIDFLELLSSNSVFPNGQEPYKNLDSYDMVLTIVYGNGQKLYMVWDENELCVADSLTDNNAQVYSYYHTFRPNEYEVASLFNSEASAEQVAKDCVSYEPINGTGSYDMRKGYSIDLNGDGIAENIFIGFYGATCTYEEYLGTFYLNDNIDTHLCLYVDGVKNYEFSLDCTDINEFQILDLNTNDNLLELVIFNEGPSCDYSYDFYHYEENQLKQIGTAPTGFLELSADENKPGSYLIQGSRRLFILQTWYCDATWQLTDHDTVELVEQPLYYPTDSNQVKLLYKVKGYQEMSLTSESVVIEPGDLFFKTTDNENWILAITEDQQEVWLYFDYNLRDEDVVDDTFDHKEYQESPWNVTIFEGLNMCD